MKDLAIGRELRPALVLFAALTVITGVAYPLLVTLAARAAFPAEAEGSLVRRGGSVVGSALIGQEFHGPGWFRSRPSATGGTPYNPMPSAGSNLGPIHPELATAIASRAAALRAEHRAAEPLPGDLLTASGSGLDPHISPAAARWQVERVARERGLPRADVSALVERHVEGRQLGVLGEPRVNVLLLNLALDSLARRSSSVTP